MAVYEYLAYDLRTGSALEQLPLVGVTLGGQLNAAGPFAATLPLGGTAQTAPGVYGPRAQALLAASIPGRTVVYVERDGVLIDGYIIWTRRYDSATQSCDLGGLSLWSYFAHRVIDYTQAFSVDQLTIARTLVTNAQAATGGNIGVAVGTETSGVTRNVNYYGYAAKPVAEAITELSAGSTGFDFAIDVAYSAGVPTATFRPSYPSRGRLISASGLVFEVGRNIVSYQMPEDATTQATRFFALGAGDGADMKIATAVRTDIIDAGWPLLDATGSWKDVTDGSVLASLANGYVAAKASPVTIPQVTITAGADPQIMQWILGDWGTFIFGGDPTAPDPRFPTRTAYIARIVGYTLTPGDQGEDLVTLTLN